MASPGATPASIFQTLTDKLLEDIFLRLPTPTALVRASAACYSFHRVIARCSFLRRFRARCPLPPDPYLLPFTPHSTPDPLRPLQAPPVDRLLTMASPGVTPSSIFQNLTDELLENIFLHLPTPAALARVSVACYSFHHVITRRSFLRRFRARYPLPLLGFIDGEGFRPAQSPHPSAPLARAVANAADFSFSFVPKPDGSWFPDEIRNDAVLSCIFRELDAWSPRDARDGRVLLECEPSYFRRAFFSGLAVCDPVYRRYVLLPPIPEDLAPKQESLLSFVPMLAPNTEEEDEASFKVICGANFKAKMVVFAFSSVTREWRVAASATWRSLFSVERDRCRDNNLSCFNYLRGCFYWPTEYGNAIVLDSRTMELSIATCSSLKYVLKGREVDSGCPSYVVVGREGALRFCSLYDDERMIFVNDSDDSADEWQPEITVQLPDEYEFTTVGATEGFLFLQGDEIEYRSPNTAPSQEGWEKHYFSLEVSTSELMLVCSIHRCNHAEHAPPYFGFPPSLSKPSI